MGVSFSPAASTKALTAIRRTIRSWSMHRRSDKGLDDLARMFNSHIRGWINYYGRFCPSALYPTLQRIDLILARWASGKFKSLRGHKRRSRHWLARIARHQPRLFAHWGLLYGRGRRASWARLIASSGTRTTWSTCCLAMGYTSVPTPLCARTCEPRPWVVLVLHRGDAVIALGLDHSSRRRDFAQVLLRQCREYSHSLPSRPIGRIGPQLAGLTQASGSYGVSSRRRRGVASRSSCTGPRP